MTNLANRMNLVNIVDRTHIISRTNRIASVMVMHVRDRGVWFSGPWIVVGVAFGICWLIALSVEGLFKGFTAGVWTGAQLGFYIVMLIGGVTCVGGTFPFAISFGTRRRDYLLGTFCMAAAVSAAWAILVVLLSLVEADVLRNWGVGLHFFHLPFFSDGARLGQFCWTPNDCAQSDPGYFGGVAPPQQFWFAFTLLLFMFWLGFMFGSVYLRFSRVGVYTLFSIVFLLIGVFVLFSSYLAAWGSIFGWLGQQTAASLGLWLIPPVAVFALVSYAMLRKATV